MLSELQKLRITNKCYACVSGMFAFFIRPNAQGPNFSWEWFVEYCEKEADTWMIVHGVPMNKKNKDESLCLARESSRQIAMHLVSTMQRK